MIDLHCHALPGIDDGPSSAAAALSLLRAAALDGTTTVVATPHVSRRWQNTPEVIEAGVARLRDEAPVQLLAGAEVTHELALRLDDAVLAQLCLGSSRCLLLETPLEPAIGPEFERCVEDLLARDYRVLLAHPERSPAMRDDPARLRALVDGGVFCSVTAAALAGGFGDASRWFGLELLRDGLVHSVDSDAHHATRRPPGLRTGLRAAAAVLPTIPASWLATTAPAALLADEPLPQPAAA